MSGRPKCAPASPEEEREQLRQLTRELHEAAKDARAAARELTAARAELAAAAHVVVDDALAREVAAGLEDLQKHFGLGIEATDRRMKFSVDHVEECAVIALDAMERAAANTEARLLGYKDRDEVQEMIQQGIHGAIEDLGKDEDFVAEVARAVQPNLKFKVI